MSRALTPLLPATTGRLTIFPRERRGPTVSVSLALAAETGRYAVVCCDGRLVYGETVADVFAPKFQWFGDWILMFAGELANTDLIVEQLRVASLEPDAAQRFSRRNIARTAIAAFKKRVAMWSAIRNVSMFGMDDEEFKNDGLRVFGEKMHSRLVETMRVDAHRNFKDQLMVVGWGRRATPNTSLFIQSIRLAGDKSHTRDGHGVIGSGRDAAMDAILRLQYGMHSSLQDAVYTAAAAKFSAESKLVGRQTSLFITRRRREDEADAFAIPVQSEQTEQLRAIWRKHKAAHGVPLEARRAIAPILELTKDEELIKRNASQRGADEIVDAFNRMSKSRKSRDRQ